MVDFESKMVDFALKLSFSGKHRQGKPPVIQKSIAMKLFKPMMKEWLKTEQFCQKCLRSQPASIIEAFNSSCYNSMNVIKAGFQSMYDIYIIRKLMKNSIALGSYMLKKSILKKIVLAWLFSEISEGGFRVC